MIKKIDGAIAFLESISNGTMREKRGEAMTTEINNHVIDTCEPGDTGKWETGIKRDGVWVIVEQYIDCIKATEGHTKWFKIIEKNPNCELPDIDLWELNNKEEEE